MNINLGPILGLEGNYDYTVCLLLNDKLSKKHFKLVVDLPSEAEAFISYESIVKLHSKYFYRFRIKAKKQLASYRAYYHFEWNGEKLSDAHGLHSWGFLVPGEDTIPNVAYSSCNGDSKKHPSKIFKKDFIMWGKMRDRHLNSDIKFNLLIMGGDQVYADSLWDKVDFLEQIKKKTRHGYRNIKTDDIYNYKFTQKDKIEFIKQLRAYYEQLYIDSWSNQDMSYIMSSIPSIMMWDDHDIVDGWGSYPSKLQNTELFKCIFQVASEYFEVFQTRTKLNQSRISKDHFSLKVSFRNYEFVVLDNRTFRTQNRIMSKQQYQDVAKVSSDGLFKETESIDKVLCFVIPVPVAHLDYSAIVESIIPYIFKNGFRHAMDDDALDHWDHKNHLLEQKQLLDMIFDAGSKSKAKYVCIISGDVHTAGAATITKKQGCKKVTQLISSAIVHKGPSKILLRMMNLVTSPKSEIKGYGLELKNYGNYKVHTINQRNFGFLTKATHSGIVASLVLEGRNNLAHRTLNKYTKGDI